MKSLQLLLCGLATVVSAAGDTSALGDEFNTSGEDHSSHWSYHDNGKNWPDKTSVKNNKCGDATVPQSPIDLKRSWPKKSNILDRFSKVYTDQTSAKVHWNDHTSETPITAAGQSIQSIYSHIADTTYGSPQRYNGVQFHFHAGSEHTIEGERQDLEMHTVHLPFDGEKKVTSYNGFVAAAMGLMFSVKGASRDFEAWEVKIIDDFFDSLEWTETAKDPVVPKVTYGKLMMFVDMQNRWTYRGSVTTPPCATAVYWNVLTTIYPIKEKHLKQFKAQLARNTSQKPSLVSTGNWRLIMPYLEGEKGHQAQIIQAGRGGNVGMLVAVIVLAIFVFVLLMVVIKLRAMLKNSVGGSATQMQVLPESYDSGAQPAAADEAK